MKNLAIVPLMAIILLFTMPQAFGAWGVSEKSVKKWEPKKLCEKSAELEIKKDWKAVAIIAKEIAARPDIDSSVCVEISKEREKEITSKKRNARTSEIADDEMEILQGAKKSGLEKYGRDYFRNLVRASCGREELDENLIKDYENYVAAMLPTAYKRSAHIATNAIQSEAHGFELGLTLASTVGPNLCSDKAINAFDRLIDLYVDTQIEPKTNQNIDIELKAGQNKKEIVEEIGDPVLVQSLNSIEVQHFCRTGVAPISDEFLALYFLNDSLLYSQRYTGSGKLGDCAEFAGQGGYEVPEAIKAIVGFSGE